MIAIAQVEVQNLVYVAGALVLIIILSLIVTLRHRKPKSVESNMESFNKGLRALAPDAELPRRRSRPLPPPVSSPPPQPARRRTVTIRAAVAPDPPDGVVEAAPDDAPVPGDAASPPGTPTSLEADTG